MKSIVKRICYCICLLFAAATLILYAIGEETQIFALPLWKLLLSVIIVSFIISKLIFSKRLCERFKIFFLLSLLACLLEKHIAVWANLQETELFNNWAIVFAGIVIDIAVGFMFPKVSKNSIHTKFSSSTYYIDPNETPKKWIYANASNTEVYYQNTDSIPEEAVFELNLNCSMGNIEVHIPSDWMVKNKLVTSMGNVEIRPCQGNGPTLIVTGTVKMGNVEIVSP